MCSTVAHFSALVASFNAPDYRERHDVRALVSSIISRDGVVELKGVLLKALKLLVSNLLASSNMTLSSNTKMLTSLIAVFLFSLASIVGAQALTGNEAIAELHGLSYVYQELTVSLL